MVNLREKEFNNVWIQPGNARYRFIITIIGATPDHFDEAVINQRYAVPQDVAIGVCDQQRPLADGKRRFHADPVEAQFLQSDGILMRLPQIIERRPLLTLPTDVLPLVSANVALLGRLVALGELGAAGGADGIRHGSAKL